MPSWPITGGVVMSPSVQTFCRQATVGSSAAGGGTSIAHRSLSRVPT